MYGNDECGGHLRNGREWRRSSSMPFIKRGCFERWLEAMRGESFSRQVFWELPVTLQIGISARHCHLMK